jgi:uncharacterized membrane protein (DUF485 family)
MHLEGYEDEQQRILHMLAKVEQGLRISRQLRHRRAVILAEHWHDREALRSYDALTARERRFIGIVSRGISHAHHEIIGVRRLIEHIRVPPGSRDPQVKELAHAKQDLLDIMGLIESIYADWVSISGRVDERLRKQLSISITDDPERTRLELLALEHEEIVWEENLLARIERFNDLEEKVNRLRATGFLRVAVPASFTFGSTLAVHSIQRGAFAPEENISGIIGVFCIVTAFIMGSIYVHEHRRELHLVRQMYASAPGPQHASAQP